MTVWEATEAQARFNDLLDKAEQEGPQIIRRGTQRFVLMLEEQWIMSNEDLK